MNFLAQQRCFCFKKYIHIKLAIREMCKLFVWSCHTYILYVSKLYSFLNKYFSFQFMHQSKWGNNFKSNTYPYGCENNFTQSDFIVFTHPYSCSFSRHMYRKIWAKIHIKVHNLIVTQKLYCPMLSCHIVS